MQMVYLAREIVFGGIFLASIWLTGWWVLHKVSPDDLRVDKLIGAYLVGAVILSTILFFLGLLNLYRTPVLVLLIGLPFLLILKKQMRGEIRSIFDSLFKCKKWQIAILGSVVLVEGVLALYPAVGFDDIAYHLAVPKQFLQKGGLATLIEMRTPVMPYFNHMLFVPALALNNDTTVQFVQLGFYLVVLAWVYHVLQPQIGKIGATCAVVVLGTADVIVEMGSYAYLEITVTAFATTYLVSFLKWLKEGKRLHWWLAALSLGGAIGTKYTAMYLVPLAPVLWLCTRKKEKFWPVVTMMAMAALVGGPWYVRNWILSGNPLFPMATSFFGPGFWNEAEVDILTEEIARYGVSRNLWEFFKLPFTFSYYQHLFHAPPYIPTPITITFPLVLLGGYFGTWNRLLLIAIFVYSIEWFMGMQIVRHFLPILPAIVILQSVAAFRIFHFLKPRMNATVFKIIALYLAIVVLRPGFEYIYLKFERKGAVPLSVEARHEFLDRFLVPYKYFYYLNQKYGSDYVLYGYEQSLMTFLADGRYMGDKFGMSGTNRFHTAREQGNLTPWLQSLGVTHVLLQKKRIRWFLPRWSIEKEDADYILFKI